MTIYYAIDDGDGNQITTGLDEHEAHSVAQRLANEQGRAVYLYEVGSGEEAEEITPTDPTHAYVRRSDSCVASVISRPIAPGSNEELRLAENAPAGCDLVDITALPAIPDEGDELTVDSDGCATAIVGW